MAPTAMSESSPATSASRTSLPGTVAARPGDRLLVPLVRGQSASALLRLGDAIADKCPGRGVVLSLIEIPARWRAAVPTGVARSRELLRWIASNDYAGGADAGRMRIESRFTSDPVTTICEALLETESDAVLAEWPSAGAQREHRLRSILSTLMRDRARKLIVVRPDPHGRGDGVAPASVLAALRGGPSAWLALSVAAAVAVQAQARLTVLHVYSPAHHPEHRRNEEAVFHALVTAASSLNPRVLEFTAEDHAEVLLDHGQRYDAVVLGAHANPRRPGILLDSPLASAMDQLRRTVIITRSPGTEDVAA